MDPHKNGVPGEGAPPLPAAMAMQALAYLHGNAAQANIPQSTASVASAALWLQWLQHVQRQAGSLDPRTAGCTAASTQGRDVGTGVSSAPTPQSSATAAAATASVAPTSASSPMHHGSTTAPASVAATSAAGHPPQSSTTLPAPLASVAPTSAAGHPLQGSTSQMSAQAQIRQHAAAEPNGEATEAGGTSARIHPHTEVGGRVSVFWDGGPPYPGPATPFCARSLRSPSHIAACINSCIHVYICRLIRIRVHVHIHVHTYTHTFMHTHVCVCVSA